MKIAVFDLDLTLTTRHLWMDLGYHRRGVEDLRTLERSHWVADQGGADSFQPERLQELFATLAGEGHAIGLATYNKDYVADCFLRCFDLLRFFTPAYMKSREDGGPKAEHWRQIIAAAGTDAAEVEGSYYDDSREECVDLKSEFPHFRIYHVERSLASPASIIHEIA